MDHNKLWKILKEMGIPDCLTCSWEIYMRVKKQQLEPDMEQWTVSKLGKEYIKAVYYLFLLYAGYIMWIAELDDSQAGIKISGKNINNLRYVDDITVTAKSDETKEPLDNSERGDWKIWLKTQCSKN